MKLKIDSKFGVREFEGEKIIITAEDKLLKVKVDNVINFVDAVVNIGDITFNLN